MGGVTNVAGGRLSEGLHRVRKGVVVEGGIEGEMSTEGDGIKG